MKKRTKQEKFQDCFDAFKCIKAGKKVKRSMTKDGSIATHSVVPVPDLLESVVLKGCINWLKRHRIFCNRHDAGAGDVSGAGYATYGIKGAGDIIGLLPNGIHFEIEVKRGSGGRLSKGQQKRQKDIWANCGLYYVVHGVSELEHCFKIDEVI